MRSVFQKLSPLLGSGCFFSRCRAPQRARLSGSHWVAPFVFRWAFVGLPGVSPIDSRGPTHLSCFFLLLERVTSEKVSISDLLSQERCRCVAGGLFFAKCRAPQRARPSGSHWVAPFVFRWALFGLPGSSPIDRRGPTNPFCFFLNNLYA